MAKPEMEFFNTALLPWKPVEGVAGAYEKILSLDPDTGSYTRLLISTPDLHNYVKNPDTPPGKTLIHTDFLEENYLLSGTLVDVVNNQTYNAGYYACRPLGMKHGPFYHPTGALTLEFRTRVKL